jgi:hypothetical protein
VASASWSLLCYIRADNFGVVAFDCRITELCNCYRGSADTSVIYMSQVSPNVRIEKFWARVMYLPRIYVVRRRWQQGIQDGVVHVGSRCTDVGSGVWMDEGTTTSFLMCALFTL